MLTIEEIRQQFIDNLEARLGAPLKALPKSFEFALSWAVAGVVFLVYKFSEFITAQQFVTTAKLGDIKLISATINPLRYWGETIGEGPPFPAQGATGTASVSVLVQSGALALGAILQRQDGVRYQTIQAQALNAATITINIESIDSGANTTLTPGTILSFLSPIANLAQAATVLTSSSSGRDEETEENYRKRVLRRFQARPQGGAISDYIFWATSVTGVKDAYPYTSTSAPGRVDLYIQSTDNNGIALQPLIDQVNQAVEFDQSGVASRRPVGAFIVVLSMVRVNYNVSVIGLVAESLPAAKTAIANAISEYFLSRKPFIVGASVPPRLDKISLVQVYSVIESVASSIGASFSGAKIDRGGGPSAPAIESLFLPVGTLARATVTYDV